MVFGNRKAAMMCVNPQSCLVEPRDTPPGYQLRKSKDDPDSVKDSLKSKFALMIP